MRKVWLSIIISLVLCIAYLPALALADTQVHTEAAIVQSVSFRDKPSASSNVYRYLRAGESVIVLDKVNAYWYHVQDAQGKIGYVSTMDKYIKITSNAVVVNSVNLRPQPTTSSTRIRLLARGEKLLVLEKMNAYWYRAVDANGTMGYVSTSATYLRTDFSVTGLILPLSEQIENVIQAGMKYLGTPYEFGSSRYDTSTFDCSDFVKQAFREGAGVTLPGDSRAQGDYVKNNGPVTTDWHQLKRGDLMFFMSYAGSRPSDYASIDKSTQTITHVGIYLGDGQILQTYSVASGGVRIDTVAGSQWENRFLFGGSVLK
jgi:cell wall-associated NlpC family hydrolase